MFIYADAISLSTLSATVGQKLQIHCEHSCEQIGCTHFHWFLPAPLRAIIIFWHISWIGQRIANWFLCTKTFVWANQICNGASIQYQCEQFGILCYLLPRDYGFNAAMLFWGNDHLIPIFKLKFDNWGGWCWLWWENMHVTRRQLIFLANKVVKPHNGPSAILV